MKPQIVNIICFIRGNEPRYKDLDILEPVKNQIKLYKKYNLNATFLLQYDALMKDEYVNLLNDNDPLFETGAWFEIVRPLVEKAGLVWHGRENYIWDWYANADFTIGYDTNERKKIIDTYFEDFRQKFGRYPESVGSWILDAFSLKYMSEQYGIKASCICRDQWGTDGYSLWGGYYGQGYYPSVNNAFCPAGTDYYQINVPVFRMLGSDPVKQYDAGLINNGKFKPSENQPVYTLEPYNEDAGGNRKWVDWFFNENFNGKCLSFGYAQVGQENSFSWDSVKEGLVYQAKLISEKRDNNSLKVQKLRDTGEWYQKQYKNTPSSAITFLSDSEDKECKSIWYSSRFYRVNFYYDHGHFWIRDLQLFNQQYKERYIENTCKTNGFVYDNLPALDGCRWSLDDIRAGIYIVSDDNGNSIKKIKISDLDVECNSDENLTLSMLMDDKNKITFTCMPDKITFKTDNGLLKLQYTWSDMNDTSILKFNENAVEYKHNGFKYSIKLESGILKRVAQNNILLCQQDNNIIINLKTEE